MTAVDTRELTAKVRMLYRLVAEQPHGTYHFPMGRALARRLGYPAAVLDRVPVEAVESFAGVGYFFDLARLAPGEHVLDLGSGSGTDAFVAAELVGAGGRVVGVDFTPEQLDKARRLAESAGVQQVEFRGGRIEDLPLPDSSVDCVISNGVINLSAEKTRVFAEAARALRPGGRLAVADIVSERQLSQAIVCNADLWASCIGGAAQQDSYRAAVEAPGLRVVVWRHNRYQFLSAPARDAGTKYGVKSVSLLAVKPAQ